MSRVETKDAERFWRLYEDCLNYWLNKTGYSQKKLAELAGISEGMVTRLKTQNIYPSPEMIRKLERTFDLPEDYFCLAETVLSVGVIQPPRASIILKRRRAK